MSKVRVTALAVTVACGLMLVGGTGLASAQTTPKLSKTVAVTGTAKGNKKFTGTYTIQRFVASGGTAYAVGTLKGKLGRRSVTKRNVRMPAAIQQGGQASQVPVPTPGACPVLTLVLGPINLDLLGLRVATNDIHVLIEAIPSSLPGGGLLGDLLCGISNLLNPAARTPLANIVQLLNALLAFAPPRPA